MDRSRIDGTGWPLAFRVAEAEATGLGSALPEHGTRAAVRALAGMQKEAIVAARDGAVWRFACDEGHYLDGTDLAPPPLDFFSAGMQFSVMSAALAAARRRGLGLRSLTVRQDNVYHIEGSFLRGDARGSAEAPALSVVPETDADADAETVLTVCRDAVRSASALALARDVLDNRFALQIRGRPVPLAGMKEVSSPIPGVSLETVFQRLRPAHDEDPTEPVISKTSEAERVENHADGAGVSLKPEQRRTIHVRSRGAWLGEGRFRTDVDLLHPIGSSFRFHAEEARPGASAPSPDAFVAAGVALCFMTQLGRYAAIRKRPLERYAVLQSNAFRFDDDGAAAALPLDTTVFLDTDVSPDDGADLVRTGERTCFLHACMRAKLAPEVTLEWKGETIAVSH